MFNCEEDPKPLKVLHESFIKKIIDFFFSEK